MSKRNFRLYCEDILDSGSAYSTGVINFILFCWSNSSDWFCCLELMEQIRPNEPIRRSLIFSLFASSPEVSGRPSRSRLVIDGQVLVLERHRRCSAPRAKRSRSEAVGASLLKCVIFFYRVAKHFPRNG